jgi:Cu/Ag efflux protein CusF
MKLFHRIWLPLLLIALVVIGCRSGSEAVTEKTYDVKGSVVAIDPQKPSVKLDHEDITGLMKGMVMEFPAASPKVLEGLRPGDKVQGKLKVEAGNNIITHLEKSP